MFPLKVIIKSPLLIGTNVYTTPKGDYQSVFYPAYKPVIHLFISVREGKKKNPSDERYEPESLIYYSEDNWEDMSE